jgi:hypothetical protein
MVDVNSRFGFPGSSGIDFWTGAQRPFKAPRAYVTVNSLSKLRLGESLHHRSSLSLTGEQVFV